MKKIILLVDALNFKPAILDFAAYIAKHGKSKVVGVFFEKHTLDSAPAIKTLGGQIYVEEITETLVEVRQRQETIRKNKSLFIDACVQREILSIVHQDNASTLENIIDETRYADLLIAEPTLSANDEKKLPSKFIMELMSKAECPVLIAPEVFENIDEIVLAYDGSRSSVFAIKQFYYLLPEFASKNVHVLHIIEEDKGNEGHVENQHFTEWLDLHFTKSSFVHLTGNARDMLFEYFMIHNEQNNKMLVTGAYGRNLLSSLFKPSAADLVLKAVDIPIFITHH